MENDVQKRHGDYTSALFISVVAAMSSLQLATDNCHLPMALDYEEFVDMEVISSFGDRPNSMFDACSAKGMVMALERWLSGVFTKTKPDDLKMQALVWYVSFLAFTCVGSTKENANLRVH